MAAPLRDPRRAALEVGLHALGSGWRVDLRNAVRPMVEAALAASDAFIALAIAKRNESIRSHDTP